MLGVVGISTILALRNCAATASVSKVCAGKNGGQEDLEDKAQLYILANFWKVEVGTLEIMMTMIAK